MKLKSLIIFLSILSFHNVFADVRLPKIIADSMILQRDAKIKIWGWAANDEKVRVSFAGKKYKTTAINGKWIINMAPVKAGGPYTMKIDAGNHLIIQNILIGDVWLCAGQSNMVHQMELHKERYGQDIAEANNPFIRQLLVPNRADLVTQQPDLPPTSWKAATPNNVGQFSAVAYFFAKELYARYKVPIGIINASVGGTPVEAWTSEDGLRSFPEISNTLLKNKDTAYVNQLNREAAAYTNRPRKVIDKGLTERVTWFDTAYVPKGWQTITLPGYWNDQGVHNLNGVVWYRKEFNVPPAMLGTPAKLALGRVVDADFTYLNGVLIGNTTYQYPQRRYNVPAGVLKPGKNVLVVRVINHSGKGGFVPAKPYYLEAGGQTFDIKGDWQYKVGEVFLPEKALPSIPVANQPTALFNGMIAALKSFSLKGIAWYQGESNISDAAQYGALLKALINDWRSQFHDAALPFVYAQLPNFGDARYQPGESSWATLRQGQLTALAVPHTAMAVTIDLGEWNDIHPDNKKDVGIRLSLAAKKIAYGDSTVSQSPLPRSLTVQGSRLTVTFDNAAEGLTTSDGEPVTGFALAGPDKNFVWANAAIQGNAVIVWSDDILNPVHVRYAWADNPVGANLYNKSGLPAAPFQMEK